MATERKMTETEYFEVTREARAIFDARYDAATKIGDYAQISLAQLDYEAFCAPPAQAHRVRILKGPHP